MSIIEHKNKKVYQTHKNTPKKKESIAALSNIYPKEIQ